ncbi:SDR family oxidoreductase [Candidatus Microgenomates bacterium]|nr:SDR family oxidoreductase [Candidatus Microgenomates bacterium]
MSIKNKVALVTGDAMGYKEGGSSIGGAIAIRLAKDGFKVVVVDLLKMGQRTVEIIKEKGGEATFIRANVTNTTEAKNIIKTAETEFGGLNCLVNCVARYSKGMAKNVAKISEDEWRKTLDVNLGGYFKMAKYSIPLILKSGGGTIINISSMASFSALPDFSVYSVSKGAIDGLTRSLAVDFAPKIRTNAICPGFVKIANSQGNRPPRELKEWYARIAKQYPMKRVCEVEEIASVVSFLASDDSSYINGETIMVDGGKFIADRHEF